MSDLEVRVREARPSDRDALVGFACAMAHETEGKQLDLGLVRPGVAAFLADPARGRAFVVESDAEVVATLYLTFEWSDWRNGFFWWIQSVYVRPTERRRGHYRRLHDHVRALAMHAGNVCGLRLYVERENRNAQATYRDLGMRETDYLLYEEPIHAPAEE